MTDTRSTHTPRRSVRIPNELWHAAQAKARARGHNLADVIRGALEEYVDAR